MKPAIMIIDMQKYFLEMDSDKFRNKLIPNIIELLTYARSQNIQIIHIATKYFKDKSNWPKSFINDSSIWCLEDTDGVQIIKELQPIEGELLVYKKRFTGFYETSLLEILKSNGYDTLFIAGYSADVCVRFTTMDAYNHGFNIFWLTDCIESAFEPIEQAVNYIKQLTKLKTIGNSEFTHMIF
jgi:nicotinamidase-related amidase